MDHIFCWFETGEWKIVEHDVFRTRPFHLFVSPFYSVYHMHEDSLHLIFFQHTMIVNQCFISLQNLFSIIKVHSSYRNLWYNNISHIIKNPTILKNICTCNSMTAFMIQFTNDNDWDLPLVFPSIQWSFIPLGRLFRSVFIIKAIVFFVVEFLWRTPGGE